MRIILGLLVVISLGCEMPVSELQAADSEPAKVKDDQDNRCMNESCQIEAVELNQSESLRPADIFKKTLKPNYPDDTARTWNFKVTESGQLLISQQGEALEMNLAYKKPIVLAKTVKALAFDFQFYIPKGVKVYAGLCQSPHSMQECLWSEAVDHQAWQVHAGEDVMAGVYWLNLLVSYDSEMIEDPVVLEEMVIYQFK